MMVWLEPNGEVHCKRFYSANIMKEGIFSKWREIPVKFCKKRYSNCDIIRVDLNGKILQIHHNFFRIEEVIVQLLDFTCVIIKKPIICSS